MEPQVLFTVAEISIGLAGFSAIVVLFKRRDSGKWLPADADRFNGMVIHSLAAALFCFLPALLGLFVSGDSDASGVWRVGSAVLGLEVLVHAGLIVSLPSTPRGSAGAVLVGGGGVVLLQFANVAQIGFAGEFLPYLVGVLWHVVHAAILFLMLIWVRDADIEER